MDKKDVILIVLWITSRCNLKCRYCYAADCKQEDMNFKTAAKALDYFSSHPMKIQFSGGEPLLNYDLICRIHEYVQHKGYDARFQMQTNGTLINTEKAKKMKEMKIALGVSLDGSPEINEMLRGGTRKAINGIQRLANEGITINLNSVVTAQNIERLPELVDLALYLGNVAGIGLDLLRDAGRAKENSSSVTKPSLEELRNAVHALYQRCEFLYEHSGKRIVIREIEEAKRRLQFPQFSKNYCYASCGRSYVILPQGEVYPCGSLINNSKYYMGNIHQGEIDCIALRKKDEGQCLLCDYSSFCPGGCPSRMIINEDNAYDESLDCVLKKTAFDIAMKTKDGNANIDDIFYKKNIRMKRGSI